MKTQTFARASRGLALLALSVLLMTSCGGAPATSSGSLRAWIDQPITGYTLPMQALTLKAHARQDGGGVTEIHFMVNDILLANVSTDAGQELTSASTTWNPSAEGRYHIQAIAFNGGGQQAMSEVSNICISNSASGPCGAPQGTTPEVSAAVDTTIKVGASPNPVSIGANCNPSDRIVNFEAYAPDTSGAIEEDIHAYLVGASGERWEFFVPLTPGTSAGSYVGTYDLGSAYDGVLAGADGSLEYTLVMLNEAKEMFRTSDTKTLTLHYCGGAQPVQGVVKVMGTPEVVFKGKCTPSAIDFVAETDIDPGMFDRVDLRYVWFDASNTWIGTTPPTENSAEMTRDAGGAYRYHLDVNTAPAGMNGGGTIKFRAAVVNTDNVDITYSQVSTNVIKPCGGGVTPQPTCSTYNQQQKQCIDIGCYYWSDTTCRDTPQPGAPPTCSSYDKQQKQCMDASCYYWSNATCNDYPEPAAPTCADFKGQSKKCAAAGCYYWSDSSCNDYPEPPPPSCDSYFKNPDGCKGAGCYYWSDNTCNDYAEPAPSCSSYLKPDACAAAGCLWDEKQSLCISY